MLGQRRSIASSERAEAHDRAFSLFVTHTLFVSSQEIACYFAQDDEFSCSSFIKTIWDHRKRCFLPVLSVDKSLEFLEYQLNDILQLNRYNILEPLHTNKILPTHLDLVLLPVVGFDLKGNRLGMGGGYYDRTFQFIKKSSPKKPFLLGLAYEVQKVETLPRDDWDVRLDGVLTEESIYLF